MATDKKPTQTDTAAGATPASASYTVNSPVLHNGKKYAVGDSIDLTPKQAKRLNVIAAPATEKEPSK